MLLKDRILNITGIRDKATNSDSSLLVNYVNTYLNDILPYEVRPLSLEKVVSLNSNHLILSGLGSRSISELKDVPINELQYPAHRYTNQMIADITSCRESIFQRLYQRVANKEEDFKQLAFIIPRGEVYFNMYTPYTLDSPFVNHYRIQILIYDALEQPLVVETPIVMLEFYKSPRIHMVTDSGFSAYLNSNTGQLIVYAHIPGQFRCVIYLPNFMMNGLIYIGDDGEVYGSRRYMNFFNTDFKVTVKPMLLTHIDDELDEDLHGLEQIIAHGVAKLIMLAFGGTVSTDVEVSYKALLKAYDRQHAARRAIRNNPKPILHSTRW